MSMSINNVAGAMPILAPGETLVYSHTEYRFRESGGPFETTASGDAVAIGSRAFSDPVARKRPRARCAGGNVEGGVDCKVWQGSGSTSFGGHAVLVLQRRHTAPLQHIHRPQRSLK